MSASATRTGKAEPYLSVTYCSVSLITWDRCKPTVLFRLWFNQLQDASQQIQVDLHMYFFQNWVPYKFRIIFTCCCSCDSNIVFLWITAVTSDWLWDTSCVHIFLHNHRHQVQLIHLSNSFLELFSGHHFAWFAKLQWKNSWHISEAWFLSWIA